MALTVHEKILQVKPDSWRGNEPKENAIKSALFGILKDKDEVEKIFNIVKQQAEY